MNETIPSRLGFNWGAFSLTALWLLTHGKVLLGVGLLALSLLSQFAMRAAPLTVLLFLPAFLGVGLYFGFAGNRIAWDHKGCSTLEELRQDERWWNIAGIAALVIVWLPVVLISVFGTGESY
jgi:hypothetical protein